MNLLDRLFHFFIGQYQLGIFGALGGIAGGIMGRRGAKKMQMPSFQQLNVGMISDMARTADIRGIQESIAAEKRFSPETYEFRKQGIEALMPLLGAEGAGQGLIDRIRGIGMSPEVTDPNLGLVQQMAFEDLQRGGALPPSVHNEVMRQAFAKGGATGLGGRDITARDIGRSSMDLYNQRMDRSTMLGSAAQQRMDQLPMQTAQLLESLMGAQTNRGLGLAQLGQSIARPKIGLGGGEMANLEIARVNQANEQALARAGFANKQQAMKTKANMGIAKGAGSLFGMMFSDRKLKTDIEKIGDDPRGFGLYRFRYIWNPEGVRFKGVMADEVESIIPDAVFTFGKFKAVDYAKI